MSIEGRWFIVVGDGFGETTHGVRLADGAAIWSDNSTGSYAVDGNRLTITAPAWAATFTLNMREDSGSGSVDADGDEGSCIMIRATDEEWAGAFTDSSTPPRDRLKVVG